MAKAAKQTKEPNAAKKVLGRRVDVGPGKLGSDVKMPKFLRAFFGYFKGSYQELRQVRWPTRRATWGMTLAVIVFTAVLVIIILSLDFGFETLFKKVIL